MGQLWNKLQDHLRFSLPLSLELSVKSFFHNWIVGFFVRLFSVLVWFVFIFAWSCENLNQSL